MLTNLKYNKHFECCLSTDERFQLEHSRQIDRELADCKRHFKATQKIVLLGAGESGKSTFLKQMQIIHGRGFSQEEKLTYRTQIYENVLKGIAGLVNGKRDLQLPWRGPVSEYETAAAAAAGSIDAEQSLPLTEEPAVRMKSVLSEYIIVYNHLMNEREQESARLNKRINLTPSQFNANLVSLIATIWKDAAIQEAYERRREFPKYFVDNVPYFIDNLDRLSARDYMPSVADILRSRRATTSITEVEMEIRKVPFRFVDVGGQRTQRQKWHQCFSDVTAILFLASASDFDEYLREEAGVNRLAESLKVFGTLVNYRYLQDVEFILFLNKHDLLRDKIRRGINVRHYFSDFRGDPRALSDVERFLISKFTALRQRRQQPMPSRRIGSGQFDSINIVEYDEHGRPLNGEQQQSNIASGASDNDKPIYIHFTTAIDTNNIKAIFDIVRLMILEKNCKSIMLN